MSGLHIDVSDVLSAAAEIGAKGPAAVNAVEPVMARAAFNIKREMDAIFRQHPWFRRIGPDVSYDRIGLLTGTLGYEIGPTPTGDAGSLAGIAVEGGANGGGGKVDIQPALTHEAARLENNIMVALGLL